MFEQTSLVMGPPRAAGLDEDRAEVLASSSGEPRVRDRNANELALTDRHW
jgi:hypothetical protein